jgi:hypothetical protein
VQAAGCPFVGTGGRPKFGRLCSRCRLGCARDRYIYRLRTRRASRLIFRGEVSIRIDRTCSCCPQQLCVDGRSAARGGARGRFECGCGPGEVPISIQLYVLTYGSYARTPVAAYAVLSKFSTKFSTAVHVALSRSCCCCRCTHACMLPCMHATLGCAAVMHACMLRCMHRTVPLLLNGGSF